MKYLISSLFAFTILIGCKSDYIEQIPEEAIGKWELDYNVHWFGDPLYNPNGDQKFDTTYYSTGNYLILESTDKLVFENNALEREELHYHIKDGSIEVPNKFKININYVSGDSLRINYSRIDSEYNTIWNEYLPGELHLKKVKD